MEASPDESPPLSYPFDLHSHQLLSMDVYLPLECIQLTSNPRSQLVHFSHEGDMTSLQRIINEKRAELGIEIPEGHGIDEEDEEIHPVMYQFLNDTNEHGYPPLLVAAIQGHLDCTEALIAAGADVDGVDQHGRSALFMASYCGHTECAWVLLKAGAEISTVEERRGWTPLHAAAYSRNQNMLKIILAAAAEDQAAEDDQLSKEHPVFVEDCLGRTPLLVSFENPQQYTSNLESCIQCLLDANSELTHCDKNGMTALHLCATHGHEEGAQFLLQAEKRQHPNEDEEDKEDEEDEEEEEEDDEEEDGEGRKRFRSLRFATDVLGRTPLHLASLNGHDKLADQISNYQILGKQDCLGLTPLHCACLNGHSQAICVLVDLILSMDVIDLLEAPDALGRKPVHALAQCPRSDDVERGWGELKEVGADLNSMDLSGRTPLMYLAVNLRSGDHPGASARALIKNGGGLGVTEEERGWNALHFAAACGNLDFLREVVGGGGISEVEKACRMFDKKGRMPFHLTVLMGVGGKEEEEEEEEEEGEEMARERRAMAVESVMGLLARPTGGIDTPDQRGRSPLLLACLAGKEDSLDSLIRAGAVVNCPDSKGRTGLMYAFQGGSGPMVERLLEGVNREGEFEKRDGGGRGVLHYLAGSKKPFFEKLSFFEEGMAQHLSFGDKNGVCPHHIAGQSGNLPFLEWLVAEGVDILVKDGKERSVVHYAAWGGKVEVVRSCLEGGLGSGGFAANDVDVDGRSLLHYAASSRSVDMIQEAVDQYPSLLSLRDHTSRPPIGFVFFPRAATASISPIPVLKVFMEGKRKLGEGVGEGKEAVDGQGNSLLHLAALSGEVEWEHEQQQDDDKDQVLKFLVSEGFNPLTLNNDGHTPIHSLLRGRSGPTHDAGLGFFAGYAAEIQKRKDPAGRNLLHWAALLDCPVSLVELGRGGGGSVGNWGGGVEEGEGGEGLTPLLCACVVGAEECVKVLLEGGGAEEVLGQTSKRGETALHLGVKSGDVGVCRLLVKELDKKKRGGKRFGSWRRGGGEGEGEGGGEEKTPFSLNQANKRGETALHLAVQKKKKECLSYLLSVPGVDLDVKDHQGRTPLDVSIEKGLEDFQELLEKKKKGGGVERGWKSRVGGGYSRRSWLPERALSDEKLELGEEGEGSGGPSAPVLTPVSLPSSPPSTPSSPPSPTPSLIPSPTPPLIPSTILFPTPSPIPSSNPAPSSLINDDWGFGTGNVTAVDSGASAGGDFGGDFGGDAGWGFGTETLQQQPITSQEQQRDFGGDFGGDVGWGFGQEDGGSLQKDLEQSKKEVQTLRVQLLELQTKYDEMQLKEDELSTQIEEMNEKNVSLSSQLKKKENELREENVSLNCQLEGAKRRESELKEENSSLSSQLQASLSSPSSPSSPSPSPFPSPSPSPSPSPFPFPSPSPSSVGEWEVNWGNESENGGGENEEGKRVKELEERVEEVMKGLEEVKKDGEEVGKKNKELMGELEEAGNKKINLVKELERVKNKLEEQKGRMEEREKAVGERESAVGEREKVLGEKESAMGEREKVLGEKESAMGEREKVLGEKENAVGEKENAVGDREKALGERERAVKEKGGAEEEKKQMLEEKERVVEEKRRVEEEKKQLAEERDRAVEERNGEAEKRKRLEEERNQAEERRKKAEEEKLRAEEKKARADEEKSQMEQENQRMREEREKVRGEGRGELEEVKKSVEQLERERREWELEKIVLLQEKMELHQQKTTAEGLVENLQQTTSNQETVVSNLRDEKNKRERELHALKVKGRGGMGGWKGTEEVARQMESELLAAQDKIQRLEEIVFASEEAERGLVQMEKLLKEEIKRLREGMNYGK